MEQAFLKKLKILHIVLIISFFIGIGCFIYKPTPTFFIIVLIYGILVWNNSDKREKIIKILFSILSLILVAGFLIETGLPDSDLIFFPPIVYKLFLNLTSFILLAFLVYFVLNTKITMLAKIILKIFLWIFIALIIVAAILIVFSKINGGVYTVDDTSIFVILSAAVILILYLPMIVLLYIVQLSINPEFYTPLIKKNPVAVIREVMNK